MAKHAAVAYALWLVGSWIGLHHLYLHRPRAAVISAVTLNGWGVAWLLDLLTLPQLVAQANGGAEYEEKLRIVKQFHAQPPLSLLVSLVQIFAGTQFGSLAACLAPKGVPEVAYEMLFVVGAALGIKFTGEALDEETSGSTQWTTTAIAAVLLPAYGYYGFDYDNDSYKSAKAAAVFLGVLVYVVTRSWSTIATEVAAVDHRAVNGEVVAARPKTPAKAYWKTMLTYWAMLGLFGAACTTAVVFHGDVRVEVNGEVVDTPFFEACTNFFQSEAFQMFTETVCDLYNGKTYEEHYEERWREFNVNLDLSGRIRYLKVLGLPRDASEKDIRSAYRKLMLQWHPDKYTGEDRDEAHANFLQIQDAYEKLVGEAAKGTASHSDEL